MSAIEKSKLDILSLLNVTDSDFKAKEYTGPIWYYPEGLNEFKLKNLRHGENDGTLPGR